MAIALVLHAPWNAHFLDPRDSIPIIITSQPSPEVHNCSTEAAPNRFIMMRIIGAALFSAIFLSSAFSKIAEPEKFIGYMKGVGVPIPDPYIEIAFWVSTVLEFVGPMLVLLPSRSLRRIGYLIVAAFLVPVTYCMHVVPFMRSGQTNQDQLIHTFKNLSILGGALMFLAMDRTNETLRIEDGKKKN